MIPCYCVSSTLIRRSACGLLLLLGLSLVALPGHAAARPATPAASDPKIATPPAPKITSKCSSSKWTTAG